MRHANAIVPETILDLAAHFPNKLAGCDFGKLLNIMVLQKRASAKSHEKNMGVDRAVFWSEAL